MKVVVACRSAFPFHPVGGAEKFVYYMAKYLQKNGVDMEIVTSKGTCPEPSAVYDGVRYTFLPPDVTRWAGTRRVYPYAHAFGINVVSFLVKKSFDLLHGFDVCSYAFLHTRRQVPVVFHVFRDNVKALRLGEVSHRGALRSAEHLLRHPFLVLLKRQPIAYSLTKSDSVLSTQSVEQTIEMVREFRLPPQMVTEVPVGVDVDFIERRLRAATITRRDMNISDDALVLISVNNLRPEKDVITLIDALALLRERLSAATLILIGTGVDQTKILTRIREHRMEAAVRHIPEAPEKDLYAYYKLADIYVSPTLQDDFMMAISEAMVCGLPVVSTSANVVVRDGHSGCLVPKRSPEAIADAVSRIAASGSAKAMGRNGRAIIQAYDWDAISQNIKVHYEKVIHAYGRN